jgi:hypothetical protein
VIAMDELLSKSAGLMTRLQNQDYYHLRLCEFDGALGRSYCLLESHTCWDESTGQMVWDDLHSETFSSVERARMRYAERRLILEQRGFVYADMDLF